MVLIEEFAKLKAVSDVSRDLLAILVEGPKTASELGVLLEENFGHKNMMSTDKKRVSRTLYDNLETLRSRRLVDCSRLPPNKKAGAPCIAWFLDKKAEHEWRTPQKHVSRKLNLKWSYDRPH